MAATCVNDLLDKSACYCLNEDPENPVSNLFIGASIRSNTDEQLLLQLSFNQTVRLSYIEIGAPRDGSCPQNIKLFLNKPNLGFDEASGRFM